MCDRWVLLLGALALHAAVRTHVDHLHCFVSPPPRLAVVLQPFLLRLLTVGWSSAESTNTIRLLLTWHLMSVCIESLNSTRFVSTSTESLIKQINSELNWYLCICKNLLNKSDPYQERTRQPQCVVLQQLWQRHGLWMEESKAAYKLQI